jgi:hypothetical protein
MLRLLDALVCFLIAAGNDGLYLLLHLEAFLLWAV